MRILVLGSAAGGGVPQWNCRCPVCRLAWSEPRRVRRRSQSSLAVTLDGRSWVLLNASPDLRQQILDNSPLHPRGDARDSPIAEVVLTNGDVDHVAGLLTLRERQPLVVHASAATHEVLSGNGVFGVLAPDVVERRTFALDRPFTTGPGLVVTPFSVPGKVPLYREAGAVEVGAETEDVVGLHLEGAGRRVAYVPGCAAVTDALKRRIAGFDALFFDGTTFTDDEMPRLGLSPKTARRMGHVAMSGPDGSLAAFSDVALGKRVFTHVNNTNPVLIEDGEERRTVEAAGWTVAHDGMMVDLGEVSA